MTRRIFLRPNDLIILNDYSPSAASREMNFLRAVLGKKKIKAPKGAKAPYKERAQGITIAEYCQINDLDEKEIRRKLKIEE
jgi:hypothetical protein